MSRPSDFTRNAILKAGVALFAVVWLAVAYWLAPPTRDTGRHRRSTHR